MSLLDSLDDRVQHAFCHFRCALKIKSLCRERKRQHHQHVWPTGPITRISIIQYFRLLHSSDRVFRPLLISHDRVFPDRVYLDRVYRLPEIISSLCKSSKKRFTRCLWLNCAVVPFSKTFFHFGVKAKRSVGMNRSAIIGHVLYTSPASRPATNAPVKPFITPDQSTQ